MKKIASLVCFLVSLASVACAADPPPPAEMTQCRQRQAEIAKQAQAFKGEEMIRRLIQADLQRASREEAEGDDDECLEALDHAAKLLAGNY